jgi:hypothetical protein
VICCAAGIAASSMLVLDKIQTADGFDADVYLLNY